MGIKDTIYEILKDISGLDNITYNQNLQKELYLDSLSMVGLLIKIEDALDILLDESDMNPFELVTVEDVIKLAEKYCGDGYE